MKKVVVLTLALVLALSVAGCTHGTPLAPEGIGEAPPHNMVMVDGAVYHNTRHQVAYVGWECTPEYWDGEITSQVGDNEVPTENGQSNFATGIGYRYGKQEGTIVVIGFPEYKCWVYATEEAMETIDFSKPILADLWGITMTVENVTPVGLTLTISQDGGAPTGELSFGPEFALEKLINGTWEAIAIPLEGGVSWNDVAYMLPLGESVEHNANWEHLYGELPAGQYRIRKRILDLRAPGDYDEQLCYAEFTIEEAKYENVSSLKKVDSADVNTLVKFDGAVYAQSYAVIDYAGGGEMLGQINMLVDGALVPYWHSETNSEDLLHAVVYECNGESLILQDIEMSGEYRLFEKVK